MAVGHVEWHVTYGSGHVEWHVTYGCGHVEWHVTYGSGHVGERKGYTLPSMLAALDVFLNGFLFSSALAISKPCSCCIEIDFFGFLLATVENKENCDTWSV